MSARPCVIVDVDGTLVDVSGVRHYVMADPRRKDFESFHAAALWCPPVPGVLEVVHALQAAGIAVVIMTSRRRKWEGQTRAWLAGHGIGPALLAMRADGDRRRDAEVKRTLHGLVSEQFTPVLAIDDNPSIVALWRELGIPTVRVPGWIEPTDAATLSEAPAASPIGVAARGAANVA